MAENKKSFILYADQIHLFEHLDDDEAGRLIKHIFKYVNDFNPEPIDKITKISFEPIKHQLKRDLKKYEGKIEQWSDAGKKSAEARRLKRLNDTLTDSTDVKNRSTVSTVNDNVNVTVNDNVINIDSRKLKFADTLKPFLAIYGKDLLNDFYHYWTEANKSKTKMKFELQKTWEVSLRLKKWSSNNFGNTNKIFNKADIIAPDYEAFVKG